MSRTVYLRPAVIHVPIVVGTGLPQKKGLSPAPCLTVIKHVKSVSFVSPCLSIPPVPSAPQCCRKSTCRRQVTKVLGNMAPPGFKSSGGLHFEGRLQPPVQDETPIDQVTSDNQCICQPSQEQLLERGVAVSDYQTGGREVVVRSSLAFYNRLFIVLKPNNKWRPILDLSKLNLFLKSETFKMETPETIRLSLQQGEWVTSLDFSDAYFHIPINPRSNLPVHGSAVWPSDSSVGVYKGCEGGKTDGPGQGYKDPPVPRRLVASSPLSGDLFGPNPDPVGLVPKARVGG